MEHLSVRSIPVTDLRQDIDGTLGKTSNKELLKIIKRGREIGVLMRPETYEELSSRIHSLEDRLEGLEETLAILSDKPFLKGLKKSILQMHKGKVRSWEKAFGEKL